MHASLLIGPLFPVPIITTEPSVVKAGFDLTLNVSNLDSTFNFVWQKDSVNIISSTFTEISDDGTTLVIYSFDDPEDAGSYTVIVTDPNTGQSESSTVTVTVSKYMYIITIMHTGGPCVHT